MAGFARILGTVVVAIALIAAQVVPGLAGCHSQRHVAGQVSGVQLDVFTHDGMSQATPVSSDRSSASADQGQPSPNDICLGNCGCACGFSGAFVLGSLTAIDAPHGVALTRALTSSDLPLGKWPDGPRRPPRTIA